MDAELLEAARGARAHAYAPYSGYFVGAALRDEHGRIHVGCNAENISYGGCICAERHAIGAMIVAGGRHIQALAVATLDGGTPCGICLQSIAEFAGRELPIWLSDEARVTQQFTLADLLPHGFSSASVARAQ
jgi:cytidine deaminase